MTLKAALLTIDDATQLGAPTVGRWVPALAKGALVEAGTQIGAIYTLGRKQVVVAPAGAFGLVTAGQFHATDVEFETPLFTVDASATARTTPQGSRAHSNEAMKFRAPMAGRFYCRPSPDEAPLIKAGDKVEPNQTVCLLEVMKTFNRVAYGADELPERAKILKVLPEDGEEVSKGQALFEIEAL